MFSPPSRFRPSFYYALYIDKHNRCFLKGDDHVESRDYAKLAFALKKPFRIECCALVDGGGMIAGRLIRQDNKPGAGTGLFKNELWFFVSHRLQAMPTLHRGA
jgi:hypothetical protein